MKKVMLYIGYGLLVFISWILKGLLFKWVLKLLPDETPKVEVEQVKKIDLSQFEIVYLMIL